MATPRDILQFWFEELGKDKWFAEPSDDLDRLITERLGPAYERAVSGDLESWRHSPEGSVALCILLDQAPRNMFRGTPRAFATDAQALVIARHAIKRDFHRSDALDDFERIFLYMPFEHSEDLADQKQCLALMQALKNDDEDWASYAREHLDLIEKFGRFPHRNRVLGRPCTQAERIFLRGGKGGFGQGGAGAVFGLDHVLIAVDDLDAAAEQWAALGFTVSERGFHKDWGTANHCIMFGDHYIEILGRVRPGPVPPGFDECVAAGRSIYGIAFAAPDAAAAAEYLQAGGTPVEPTARLSRPATGALAGKQLDFELVRPEQSTVFGPPSFVCVHKTPDLVWQPALLTHGNGATEIASVSVAVPTADDTLASRYAHLVGEACVRRQPEGLWIDLWGIGLTLAPDTEPVLEIAVAGEGELQRSNGPAGTEVRLGALTLRFVRPAA